MKLFLLFLFCHISSQLKHSMKVFYIASSGIPNFPEIVAVVQINDIETGYCDSKIKTAVPKQSWMENLITDDPQYWKWYQQACVAHQQFFKEQFQALKKRLNQTGNLHILQSVTSCEWDNETDQVNGLHLYGFDGEDFLALDLETQTWIAPKPQSVITKHLWDKETATNSFAANFVSQQCLYCLKKNLHYGGGSLLRTALPSVSLLQKTPSSPVSCHATGFYPDRADLFWRKDGEELHEDVDKGEILPNHDVTFQMSVDLDLSSVSPADWGRYDCVFQLSGVDIVTKLDKGLIRSNWAEKPSSSAIPISAAVAILFVVIGAAAASMIYKKKKAESPPCSPEDSSELAATLNSDRG